MLDWLYPPECGGCSQLGVRWCGECQKNVPTLGNRVCPICGNPQSNSQPCLHCTSSPPAYQALRSWGSFTGPLRKALHRLKYKQDIGLGEALAVPLITMTKQLNWKPDFITAVPLGAARLKERGYNQARLLAYPMALALNIPTRFDAIQRTRETRSQVGLNRTQRRQNVQGAFQASPAVTGKTVLVIDDVTTTGATLQACAVALKTAGAAQVYALTLARAIHHLETPDAQNNPEQPITEEDASDDQPYLTGGNDGSQS